MITHAANTWFSIALLAPALWAIGNHIDKYLLDRELKSIGIGPLLLLSSLVGLPAMAVILAVHSDVFSISPRNGVLIVLNGILYVLSLIPYYYALQRDEASIVVPLFQTTAVFSYLFGLFVLDEKLTLLQIAACLLIVFGSALLTLEINRKKSRMKFDVFALMLAASFLNALNWLLFKYVAIHEDFWKTSFWEYVGFVLVALCALLFGKSLRSDFVDFLRMNRSRVLGLVGLNELVSIGAKTATNIASLAAPLALISTVHGLQPFFVLIYGVLLTLAAPHHFRENLTTVAIIQKIAAITLTVGGTLMLNS
jgi:uncharacterized membrane protein